ncbi:type III pantothenate kinase [Paraliomyxa miuraensis]|uniref:type III pantothenate kinase n=1 Tax=Paraliomyxa miuraensis TaxID=376150 RepID=UPI00225201CD|nr:type III pantothenate kinase [Paraliomyxa miuraensis]MCX4239883.1 type III pantothenate kinase [Paraliomyxa miuraensis]
MLLAVDVGNSHTTVGVFEGEVLRCELRLATRREWTRDELAVGLRQALGLAQLDFSALDQAIVACVVPPVLGPLTEALVRYADIEPLVVGPGIRTGMPIRYDPPQDVGADRIVTAVAAHERHRDGEHGLIVVDFGTATTFDVVTPRPEYLGGVIAPGIGIAADALFERAAKLPRVDISRPDRVVGRNTVGAIQSGLVYGYIGLVEGLIARIRSEVDWPCRVVATGGFASIVARESSAIDVVDDALVLEGLRLIHGRNGATGSRGTKRAPS